MNDVWQAFREYDLEQRKAQQSAFERLREKKPVTAKSPIEVAFSEAWQQAHPEIELLPQFKIGKYRVDFVHEATQTVIELDGHNFHSKRKDRNKDYARQHTIEDQGWHFIRFTGSQVRADMMSCVSMVYSRIVAGQG